MWRDGSGLKKRGTGEGERGRKKGDISTAEWCDIK